MTITRQAPRRPPTLPEQRRETSRGAAVVRGLAALAGTLLLVGGVPIALLKAFGSPLPQSAPSRDWLTQTVSTETVLQVIAVVVWLAWLHLCVCLVVELVAERRGRGLAPRVAGGGIGTQALAHRLVAAMLLVAGTAGVTMSTAAAASAPSASPVTVAATTADGADQGLVGGGIAAARAHAAEQDAERPAPILNAMKHADGSVAFYKVMPPHNRHYDTLWDIAERYLGDGLRYKEIYALNRGIMQPDGSKLERADLIQPGWLLRLPADAKGPGLRVVDTSVHDAQDGGRPGARAGSSVAPVGSGSTVAPGQATTRTPQAAQAATGTADATVTSVLGLTAEEAPPVGVAGGLLAAGLLLSLRRRRAGAPDLSVRGVPVGAGPDDDPDGPRGGRRIEAELRAAADLPSGELLARALREWEAEVTPEPDREPAPVCVMCSVSPRGLALSLASAPAERASLVPPTPWRRQGDGRVWLLRRDDGAGLAPAPDSLSMAPGLVAVGQRDEGSLLLLNLEAVDGVVSLGGDLDQARGVALSWAVDVATHAWADDRRVTLVGFADDLSAVGDGRIRSVADLERALESMEVRLRRQRRACQELGVASVREGRVTRPDARLWATELLVLSGVPSPDTVARLSELAAAPDQSALVVVVGDVHESPARLVCAPDGRISSGPWGIDVTAQRLSVEAYRGLVDLFTAPDFTAPDPDTAPDGSGAGLPVPVLDPAVLDLSVRQPVEVRVLGPVVVETEHSVDDDRRDLLTEIVVFVALQPGGVHPNVLTSAIWPRGIDSAQRQTAMEQAQAWLGDARDGAPRLRTDDDGRWVLVRDGVRVDLDVLAASVRAAEQDPVRLVPRLETGLSVVRAEPWTGLPAGRYSWLAYGSVEQDARAVAVQAARRLAAACAEDGDADGARRALQCGLVVAPAAEDLWRDALRQAQQLGSGADVRAVADGMYAAVARHGSPRGVTAETEALVDELLPGYRRSAA